MRFPQKTLWTTFGLWLILLLLLAACSSSPVTPVAAIAPAAEPTATVAPAPTNTATMAQPSSPADARIRPLEEITGDAPPRLENITPTGAVLVFNSEIPLACAIVYGETTTYGMLTLDQDMAGGAHTDHRPLMANLKPDTVYHYRLQGSAEDGTIYMSDDMTFRTPPAPKSAEINLASMEAGAKVVAVSSNYGGAANDATWGANSALDGNQGTEWSSNGDGDGAFIEIALAKKSRVNTIEVWTRSMSNNTAQIFKFTVTTDSGKVLGPFDLPDAGKPYRFDVDVEASTLRLDVMASNGGNTGLVEFAAYGTPVE